MTYQEATPAELADEKKFYARFYALHRDPELVSVVLAFGPEVLRRSSVLEGFENIIQDNGIGGGRCVEIGTYKGLTALVLSRYFDEVVTIDIVPDPQREEIAKHCGVKNIKFVTVRTNADKAAVINGLTFDAAFVDGNHAYDTETDFGLVSRCGRVLLHEYWKAQPAVWELVLRLRNQGFKIVTHGKFALIWTR